MAELWSTAMLLLALPSFASAASHQEEGQHAGQRLVGADRVQHSKVPFIVAWTVTPDEKFSCTGSLLTSKWMLSAAHCNKVFSTYRDEAECIEKTTNDGSFRDNKTLGNETYEIEYKCTVIQLHSMEIALVKSKGKAWIGADDLHQVKEDDKTVFITPLKRMIRNPEAYVGDGSYGTFGGYDITLIELENEVPTRFGKQACIPAVTLKDDGKKANLAGYGTYFRRNNGKTVCLTDEFGRNKYHLCSKLGDGNEVCSTSDPPQAKACKQFFKKKSKKFSDDFEEAQIVDKKGVSEFCFHSKSPRPGSKGWCNTSENYYGLKMEKGSGWGFCSKDCYLGKFSKKENLEVLRIVKNVDILPEKLCKFYLNFSVSYKSVFVPPEVMCVGYLKPWKTQVWKKQGSNYKELVKAEEKEKYRHFGNPFTKHPELDAFNSYVTSAGTCQGDSGGPVYIERKNGYLVLGVVSGGKGEIGNCGGINNPVHYARLSQFSTWIKAILGPDKSQLCWGKPVSRDRRQRRLRRHRRHRRW